MASGSGADLDAHVEARDRLVDAALRVVAERGLADLTVRRIAEAAGTSTMSVYSRFGGRAGVLEALYRRTFAMLGEALAAVPSSADVAQYLMDLAMAYRGFALAGPSRYAFMFDRPFGDFQPGPGLRSQTLLSGFAPLVAAVRQAVPADQATRTAYCLWCVMHGMVGLELAEVLQTPVPGWGIEPVAGAAERMYLVGVRAMLAGLELPGA